MNTNIQSLVILLIAATMTACGSSTPNDGPSEVAAKVIQLGFEQQWDEAFNLVDAGPGVSKDEYIAKRSGAGKQLAAIADHCGGVSSVKGTELKREGSVAIVSVKVTYRKNQTLACKGMEITQKVTKLGDGWRMIDR